MPLLTKILKPEELNSLKLAQLSHDAPCSGVRTWESLDPEVQRLLIDRAQWVLDSLVRLGVLE